MFSLPPAVLLIPYAAFLLGFTFFAFANVVSLAKYGARNAIGLTVSFAFIAGTAVILFLTWKSLEAVDWKGPVTFSAVTEQAF